MAKKKEKAFDAYNMRDVKSSNIKSVGYIDKLETLKIEFHNGMEYNYKPIEKPMFQAMLIAESVGEFFGKYIRSNKAITATKIKG